MHEPRMAYTYLVPKITSFRTTTWSWLQPSQALLPSEICGCCPGCRPPGLSGEAVREGLVIVSRGPGFSAPDAVALPPFAPGQPRSLPSTAGEGAYRA